MPGHDANEADQEVRALTTVLAVLAALDSDDARRRILAYANDRFRRASFTSPDVNAGDASVAQSPAQELAGVAVLKDGELKVIVRDLKARSGLDAAVRLAHVAIFAQHKLSASPLSSRKGLTPILRQWRVYDGNTRARLAREKGILRDGDNLSLDTHAQRDAERFISEILDDAVKGSWKPK